MTLDDSSSSIDEKNERNYNRSAVQRQLSFSYISGRPKMRRRSSNLSAASTATSADGWCLGDAVHFEGTSLCEDQDKMNIFQQIAIQCSDEKALPAQEIIKRSTFIFVCMSTIPIALLLTYTYYALGEIKTATLPFVYALCSGSTLLLCRTARMYALVVPLQLFLIFILPLAGHLSLGGLQESGGVALYSFLAPLGAAFYRSPTESLRWLLLYISAILVLMYLEFHNASHVSQRIQVGYWTMNILGVSAIAFAAAFIFGKDLEEEYRRSEDLLQNILPKPIAKRIKQGELPIVDNLDDVTILFADLVGFTKACSTMCPQLLIGSFLLDVFSAFDKLVVNRGLEKIKTIGDAYMVVGGLNNEANQNHAKQVLYLAMEMIDELGNINKNYDLDFKIRVGVHTGPVIAGVLGVSKFAYGKSQNKNKWLKVVYCECTLQSFFFFCFLLKIVPRIKMFGVIR